VYIQITHSNTKTIIAKVNVAKLRTNWENDFQLRWK